MFQLVNDCLTTYMVNLNNPFLYHLLSVMMRERERQGEHGGSLIEQDAWNIFIGGVREIHKIALWIKDPKVSANIIHC